MTTIIDYGIGNLRSIEKAFEHVGADVERTDDPCAVSRAERLVLPGVGAFGACIDEIRRRDLEQPIRDFVAIGRPFLGVCVGMQLLFETGEERGMHEGLGLLPGRVVHLHEASPDAKGANGRTLKVPHMGWNTVRPTHPSHLFEGVAPESYFYFVHSYCAVPAAPEDVLAATTYGAAVPAAVGRNNVYGVQFHPEKSQHSGLRLLKNFATL